MSENRERRSKRSELLIGVFIGIYGNWLISLADKLAKDVGYPMMLFISSFFVLLWYFREAFKNEPTFVKRWRLGDILGSAYLLLIGLVLYFKGLFISEYIFSAIGIILWFMLWTVERQVGA